MSLTRTTVGGASQIVMNNGHKAMSIDQMKAMFCDTNPRSYSESKLRGIAKEFLSIKQQEKLLKSKYEELRSQAMELMPAGSECRTDFGTLKFQKGKTKHTHSKELLVKELASRGFNKADVDEILESSIKKSKIRKYIAFYPKKIFKKGV